MKKFTISILAIPFLLSACQKSEEEKFYEKMNQGIESSEMQKKLDKCIRDKQIKNTDIDCEKEFPVPSKK